jgi:hypothetical protein
LFDDEAQRDSAIEAAARAEFLSSVRREIMPPS